MACNTQKKKKKRESGFIPKDFEPELYTFDFTR